MNASGTTPTLITGRNRHLPRRRCWHWPGICRHRKGLTRYGSSQAARRPGRPGYALFTGAESAQAPVTGALDLARALPDSPERERLIGTLAEKAIAEARTARYGRGYETWNLRYRIGLFIVLLPHLPEPHLSAAAEEVVRMIVDRFADPLEAQPNCDAGGVPARAPGASH